MADFGEAMKSNSVNSLRGVLTHCDFGTTQKVVDVGGGFGHLAIALLEKFPNLHAVVLDMPDLIPIAKKNNPVNDPAVSARLEYVAGNMFDSVPVADAYVMKHIIHDWEDERCVQLLRNCGRSMLGDGRVYCIDSVVPPMGDTSGVTSKLLDLVMMTFITGKERTLHQWEAIYAGAGFRIANVTPLHDNMGTSIIEGVKQ
jgi:ubiquinone/menaquinone biosynthesis C-methylase UbiE